MTKEILFEKLMASYAPYYNICRDVELSGLKIAADAQYHARDEQYVLTRRAQLWAAESNEYAFFVMTGDLDADTVRRYYDVVLPEGMSRVTPGNEHMRSDITLIFLADSVQPEAACTLEKLKYSKSFRFCLHGWAQFRVAALAANDGQRFANRLGRQLLRDWKKKLAI